MSRDNHSKSELPESGTKKPELKQSHEKDHVRKFHEEPNRLWQAAYDKSSMASQESHHRLRQASLNQTSEHHLVKAKRERSILNCDTDGLYPDTNLPTFHWRYSTHDGRQMQVAAHDGKVQIDARMGAEVLSAQTDRHGIHIERQDSKVDVFKDKQQAIYDGSGYHATVANHYETLTSKASPDSLQVDKAQKIAKILGAHVDEPLFSVDFKEKDRPVIANKSDKNDTVILSHTFKPLYKLVTQEKDHVGKTYTKYGDVTVLTPDGRMGAYSQSHKAIFEVDVVHSTLTIQDPQSPQQTYVVDLKKGTVKGSHGTLKPTNHFMQLHMVNGELLDTQGHKVFDKNLQLHLQHVTVDMNNGSVTTIKNGQKVIIAQAGNGQSFVDQGPAGKVTLKSDGEIIADNPKVQTVFSSYSPDLGITATTASGAKAVITLEGKFQGITLTESNGQVTKLSNDGSVLALDASGREIYSVSSGYDLRIFNDVSVTADGQVSSAENGTYASAWGAGSPAAEAAHSTDGDVSVAGNDAANPNDVSLGVLVGDEGRLYADITNLYNAIAAATGRSDMALVNALRDKLSLAQDALARVKYAEQQEEERRKRQGLA